jgi:hypothetical protein
MDVRTADLAKESKSRTRTDVSEITPVALLAMEGFEAMLLHGMK